MEDVHNDQIVQCPECEHICKAKKWRNTTVPCEDCGEHSAVICPNCDEVFDTVFVDPTDFYVLDKI